MKLWSAMLLCFPLLAGAQTLPEFASVGELESFLLSPEEDGVSAAMNAVFPMELAGKLATAVINYGPANASRASGIAVGSGLRQSYGEMADYLDRFGPCQKSAAEGKPGWWSNYGKSPGDDICSELVKLIFGAALWNQVEYCRRFGRAKSNRRCPCRPDAARPTASTRNR